MEAAIDLYIELGVSGTTMQQVARSADVAPGTLRNHSSYTRMLEVPRGLAFLRRSVQGMFD